MYNYTIANLNNSNFYKLGLVSSYTYNSYDMLTLSSYEFGSYKYGETYVYESSQKNSPMNIMGSMNGSTSYSFAYGYNQ